MFIKAKALTDFKMECRDGLIGRVEQFYFDDLHWTVRYLVADSSTWLPGKAVLISPYALGTVSKERQSVFVNLTKKQIEDSPSPDSDKPVSQQFEQAHSEHFGWPPYWDGPGAGDHHLRSTRDVGRYAVEALDGPMGHVEDFVLDDGNWAIRYLVVNTRDWWPGAKVLIAPQWIERVSWGEGKVFINLSRESIKSSPEYSEFALLSRDYEEQLHKHYARLGYWNHALPSGKR